MNGGRGRDATHSTLLLLLLHYFGPSGSVLSIREKKLLRVRGQSSPHVFR